MLVLHALLARFFPHRWAEQDFVRLLATGLAKSMPTFVRLLADTFANRRGTLLVCSQGHDEKMQNDGDGGRKRNTKAKSQCSTGWR